MKRRLLILLLATGGVAAMALLMAFTAPPRRAPARRRGAPSVHRAVRIAPAKAVPRLPAGYASLSRRDLFKPLVVGDSGLRRDASGGGAGSGDSNGSSAGPAAKDASPAGPWRYTGTVSIDGAPFALVQDGPDGDWGYLPVGAALGDFRIRAIQSSALLLVKSDGGTVTLPKTSGALVASGKPPVQDRNSRASPNLDSNVASRGTPETISKGTPETISMEAVKGPPKETLQDASNDESGASFKKPPKQEAYEKSNKGDDAPQMKGASKEETGDEGSKPPPKKGADGEVLK